VHRGKLCSEKLLAKDSGDDRLDLNRNPPGPEQPPTRWDLEEGILPKVLEQFDPAVDPVRVEDKLYSEIEESRRERTLARENMEDEQDRGDEDDDDQSETYTERMDEDTFTTMGNNFASPISFLESSPRKFDNTPTQSRMSRNEIREDIPGRFHLPRQQALPNVSHFQPNNNNQHSPVVQSTYSPSFQSQRSTSSGQAFGPRHPSHAYPSMMMDQGSISTFANLDSQRTQHSRTSSPRDTEITDQITGLSVSAPGAPRYPAAARLGRLGNDIARVCRSMILLIAVFRTSPIRGPTGRNNAYQSGPLSTGYPLGHTF